MKFESKYGIGEIVIYDPFKSGGCTGGTDQLLEVQAVSFSADGTAYLCRYPKTGITTFFSESQLEGDPLFDQEKGCYDKEHD